MQSNIGTPACIEVFASMQAGAYTAYFGGRSMMWWIKRIISCFAFVSAMLVAFLSTIVIISEADSKTAIFMLLNILLLLLPLISIVLYFINIAGTIIPEWILILTLGLQCGLELYLVFDKVKLGSIDEYDVARGLVTAVAFGLKVWFWICDLIDLYVWRRNKRRKWRNR